MAWQLVLFTYHENVRITADHAKYLGFSTIATRTRISQIKQKQSGARCCRCCQGPQTQAMPLQLNSLNVTRTTPYLTPFLLQLMWSSVATDEGWNAHKVQRQHGLPLKSKRSIRDCTRRLALVCTRCYKTCKRDHVERSVFARPI